MKVEIGPKRIDSIVHNACVKLQKRHELLVKKLHPFEEGGLNDPAIVMRMFEDAADVLWEGYEDVRARIPDNWCDTLMQARYEVEGVILGWAYLDRSQRTVRIPAHVSTAFVFPVSVFTGVARPALEAYIEAHNEHEVEIKTVVGTLNTILRKFKTLNEALAAYPAIEEYVSPEDMERVRATEPQKKAKKGEVAVAEEQEGEFDPASLSLLSAINKL